MVFPASVLLSDRGIVGMGSTAGLSECGIVGMGCIAVLMDFGDEVIEDAGRISERACDMEVDNGEEVWLRVLLFRNLTCPPSR